MSKISSQELLSKKEKSKNIFITACAVVIAGKMLFVGNTHQECLDKVARVQKEGTTFELGFLGTDGKFYSPADAGLLAYQNRQTETLKIPLMAEDLL